MNQRLDITINGQSLFFFTPTDDGYIFGLDIPEVKGAHLTVMYKEGRFGPHVTDPTKSGKPPWGQQFEPEFIIQIVEKHFNRWKRRYHGNTKCWIATKQLKDKVNKALQEAGSSDKIPLELVQGQIIFDPWNPKRWKRVRVREIISKNELAIIDDIGVLRSIIPVDEKEMWCYSERQFRNMMNEVYRMLGFDSYFEYITKKYGEEVLEKGIMKKIGND